MTLPASPPKALNPALKFALELGPLALFFIAFWKFDIFVATGVMIASVFVTLSVSWFKLGRIPIMPLVTAVIVVIFGSLTLIFHNETILKIKPTVLYLLFAGALFFGLWARRPILQIMFDGALKLTAEGWRILTWRWAFFFLALAVLNEIVWRSLTTEHWVAFKSFGIIPLTILFAVAQTPLIQRFEAKDEEGTGEAF